MYNKLSDIEITALIREGNAAAFTEIYDRYHDGVYRFIRKYLKSSELSEDICQNVFVKIWEQREKLIDILEFGAYAFTIAKRQSFDFLKRAAVEQHAMALILQKSSLAVNTTGDDQRQVAEYMAFIEDVLTRLPQQTQRVFKLCRQEYKSYDEAAELLGISRNAVKKHMVRSMKVLKDAAETDLGISLSILLAILTSNN